MNESTLKEILEKHKKWLAGEVGGERADLRDADLSKANLNRADLSGANLDFSCLPLWCGSLSAHFDDRQLAQIAYHICKAGLRSKNASEETKRELQKIASFANTFRRADECGLIEEMVGDESCVKEHT